MAIRDRILGLRRVPAAELRANPKNWRRHPETQARALRSLMGEVGWAEAVLAHETPKGLELIDGHLRLLQAGEGSEVPVLVLDVSAEEADLLPASLDPIGTRGRKVKACHPGTRKVACAPREALSRRAGRSAPLLIGNRLSETHHALHNNIASGIALPRKVVACCEQVRCRAARDPVLVRRPRPIAEVPIECGLHNGIDLTLACPARAVSSSATARPRAARGRPIPYRLSGEW